MSGCGFAHFQVLAHTPNYQYDAAGRIQWRTEKTGGLPPSATALVCPYDLMVRYARRGHTTAWKGFLAHVSETCDDDRVKVITDVAATAATEHLVDSGCVSVVLVDRAARNRHIDLVGLPRTGLRRYQQEAGFGRARVRLRAPPRHLPRGQVSRSWHGPCPTSSETAAPVIMVKLSQPQCEPAWHAPRLART
ncbi:hypothetical protein RB200_35500 [Streptomyces sp. PmtG]